MTIAHASQAVAIVTVAGIALTAGREMSRSPVPLVPSWPPPFNKTREVRARCRSTPRYSGSSSRCQFRRGLHNRCPKSPRAFLSLAVEDLGRQHDSLGHGAVTLSCASTAR
jgi:hypothetical protein